MYKTYEIVVYMIEIISKITLGNMFNKKRVIKVG